MAITVAIADDQDMVRTGFRMILESRPDIEVLDDVVEGEAAPAAVERHQPDVLLLDIRMPRLDGLEVTRRLAGRTTPRIVIVTTFDLDEYVHAALHGGASGFLLKDAGPAMLVEAVRAASVGDPLVSPAITVRLLREMAPAPRRRGRPPPSRTPHRTRAGRRPLPGPRPHQRRDRRRALRIPLHRQDPPGQRPDQTRRPQPGAGWSPPCCRSERPWPVPVSQTDWPMIGSPPAGRLRPHEHQRHRRERP